MVNLPVNPTTISVSLRRNGKALSGSLLIVEGGTIQPCETGSVLEWNFLEGTFSRGERTGYVKEQEWGIQVK
jgi:hypothetical protein